MVEFKRKIGLGKTKLKLRGVNASDKVVQGVLDAQKALDGAFPEHVREIVIHKNSLIENLNEPDVYTLGIPDNINGLTTIHLYKGSISRGYKNARIGALITILHEVDHANYVNEQQCGFWFDGELDIPSLEHRAKKYSSEQFWNFMDQANNG